MFTACGDTERATADEGKRDQTIANIGLVVGGVGIATAISFLVFRPSSDDSTDVSVNVGPTGILVDGRF